MGPRPQTTTVPYLIQHRSRPVRVILADPKKSSTVFGFFVLSLWTQEDRPFRWRLLSKPQSSPHTIFGPEHRHLKDARGPELN